GRVVSVVRRARSATKRAGKVQRSRQSVVRQAGSGTIRQTRYKGADWRVVRNSRGQDRRSSIRVKDQAGSDRKQTGCRYRGSWETYTKT
ncbi:unnamed protein product, partial [Staurois parvus]